ncbi:hypothetical protein HDE_00536 [Halotydeus destructor]|nr:hypothetical protein HDE_00536 [Halotydeus destructor]
MSKGDLREVRRSVRTKCERFDFDRRELDMVQTNDWFVRSFLADSNGDIEVTAAAILKALVYRKRYQVYNIQAQDLPVEMYGWMVKMGQDVAGKPIMWANLGCHRRIPELVGAILNVDYLVFHSLFSNREQFDFYADLRGSSLQSLDMRLSRKQISRIVTCFPGMVDHLYIFGLPVILTTAVQALAKMLPGRFSDRISFMSLEQAEARVSHLKSVKKPEGSSIRQVLLRDSVPEARIDKIVETFEFAQRESDQLFANLQI